MYKDVIDISLSMIMLLVLTTQTNIYIRNVVSILLTSFHLMAEMGLFLCMGRLLLARLLPCWAISRLVGSFRIL